MISFLEDPGVLLCISHDCDFSLYMRRFALFDEKGNKCMRLHIFTRSKYFSIDSQNSAQFTKKSYEIRQTKYTIELFSICFAAGAL